MSNVQVTPLTHARISEVQPECSVCHIKTLRQKQGFSAVQSGSELRANSRLDSSIGKAAKISKIFLRLRAEKVAPHGAQCCIFGLKLILFITDAACDGGISLISFGIVWSATRRPLSECLVTELACCGHRVSLS